jgi:hypothetical protein
MAVIATQDGSFPRGDGYPWVSRPLVAGMGTIFPPWGWRGGYPLAGGYGDGGLFGPVEAPWIPDKHLTCGP